MYLLFTGLCRQMFTPARLCAAICFCKMLHLSHMFLAAHYSWLYVILTLSTVTKFF
uniref:Uncharacterized protein n=1 Tax=Anguilla anguilla TaxID=7936 RepID=A0A0E9XA20_ANGAN